MHLTDFLGKEYGPGDLVIYAAHSGRAANMVVGRVVDIWRVWHNSYYVGERYGWERLADDEPVPHHFRHDGEDLGECDTGTRVKIQPLRGARWEQHSAKTYYVDTRNGKRINPDAPSGKHILKESHYVYADGREYDYAGEQAKWDAQHLGRQISRRSFEYYGFRAQYHVNYGPPGIHDRVVEAPDSAKTQLWWVSRTYQPWVEKHEEGPKPVTIEITGNIVKWEGELPGEVPDEVS